MVCMLGLVKRDLWGLEAESWFVIASYSVIHNSIAPSKELRSKMALEEVGMSLP